MTGRPFGWDESQDLYLAAMRAAMRAAGRASGTVRLHRHYLGLLRRSVAPAGPWEVSPAALVMFLAREGWLPETRKSARSVTRGFYRWAHGMGWLAEDPAAGLAPVSVAAGGG